MGTEIENARIWLMKTMAGLKDDEKWKHIHDYDQKIRVNPSNPNATASQIWEEVSIRYAD